ncbi:MAG: MarR family winged helix-turn-helix transcriptional regulator [Sulfitobacter sp.]
MNDSTAAVERAELPQRRHPPVNSIEDVIVFKLARLVGINDRAGHRWSEQLFDLSLNEWRMLALVQANAPVRAGDLAELMLMDKSQLSRLIRSLSKKRLIKSMPDKDDARAIVIEVTSKGQMLYEEVMAEVLRRNERVLEVLSPEEVAQFDRLLGRLIQHNLALLEAMQRAAD